MTPNRTNGVGLITVSVLCKDPLVRAGIAATLSVRAGFMVHCAHESRASGTDTVVLNAVRDAHVMIADYDSGLAAARTLRTSDLRGNPPMAKIMIVSQRQGESDVRRALKHGVQGYLPLDCTQEELTEGVVALHHGQRCLGQSIAQCMAESFGYQDLTVREAEVLHLISIGDANKVVARKLNIALGTVKVHVRSIMSKLGARTRTEAAAVARRRGLCDADLSTSSGAAPGRASDRGTASYGTSWRTGRFVMGETV